MRRNNMGKKYLDTRTYTLEASVMDVWDNLEEEEQIFEAVVREGMKKLDPVGQADGDINNDDVEDETDDYLKNRRRVIGRAMKGKKTLKANYGMGEDFDLDEGTKQVLAHGGKGQYKAVKDGDITKVMYKGKVVGTADFDSGADSFFASIKGVRGQKSFDDAQAMVNYFAKNKITEEVLDEADELDIGAGSKRPRLGMLPPKDRRPGPEPRRGMPVTVDRMPKSTPRRGMLPPKDREGRVKPSRQMLQKSSSELDIGAKKDSDPNRSDAKSQRRIPRKKMGGDGGAAADDLGGPKGMKPVSATGGKELDIAPGGPDKEIKNQSREIKNPAKEIKNPAKEMERDSGGYKPITGKEKPSGGYKSITGKEKSSGGYKSIGEARQKPYVSSDSDGKHVMNASGQKIKSFKDMAAANAYLKRHYNELMDESFEIRQYQEFKVQSMREALEEVWGK